VLKQNIGKDQKGAQLSFADRR